MARLIDADARVTVQSFDPMNEEYYHNEMTVEQALDFATDEGCPPIVAAIPVIHAWWKDKGNETVSCSRCATWFPKERKPYLLYCGYCGAKMDGERRAEP